MKIEIKSEPISDADFSKILAATLDKSVVDIDDVTAQRLKKLRAKALAQATLGDSSPQFFTKQLFAKQSMTWLRYGAAASLLMLIAIPVMWKQHSEQQFSGQQVSEQQVSEQLVSEQQVSEQQLSDIDTELVSQDVPVAEELDDMDMLMAMDEADA